MTYDKPFEYDKQPKLYEDKGYYGFFDKKHPLANKWGWVYLHRHIASIKMGAWIQKINAPIKIKEIHCLPDRLILNITKQIKAFENMMNKKYKDVLIGKQKIVARAYMVDGQNISISGMTSYINGEIKYPDYIFDITASYPEKRPKTKHL